MGEVRGGAEVWDGDREVGGEWWLGLEDFGKLKAEDKDLGRVWVRVEKKTR